MEKRLRKCPAFKQVLDFRKLFEKQKDKDRVTEALEFANATHYDCVREDKSPYITHPLAVANYAREYGCSIDPIIAAILHDVIEESAIREGEGIRPSIIESKFGLNVVRMVVNLTKPKLKDGKWIFADSPEYFGFASQHSHVHYYERSRVYYEHLINSRDVDAILIKLFDNLHNLETLKHVPPEKRVRNSQIIAQHSMLIVSRLFSQDTLKYFKKKLQNINPELDVDRYIEVDKATYEQKVVELPPREHLNIEMFRRLPLPYSKHICVYGTPQSAVFTGKIEIGLPEDEKIDYLPLLKAELDPLGLVVKRGESLLPKGVAARESIFTVMGFPQNHGNVRFAMIDKKIVITTPGLIVSADFGALGEAKIQGDMFNYADTKYKLVIGKLNKFYDENLTKNE